MAAGHSGFAAEARARSAEHRRAATAGGSTQWPDWSCINCHRKFPEDTPHVKCPGKLSHGDVPSQPCGGYLIRWQNYEVKR